MPAGFEQYKKQITNPLKFRLFLLQNLPSVFFAGIKLVSLSEEKAIVTVKQKWFNKNPFRSIYFAILTMAAEVSTGVLCMGHIYKKKPGLSMLAVKSTSAFHKKATGTISFACSAGKVIEEAVNKAIVTKEGVTVDCVSTAYNGNGEVVATFTITWSFKARN